VFSKEDLRSDESEARNASRVTDTDGNHWGNAFATVSADATITPTVTTNYTACLQTKRHDRMPNERP
jgi:hypothetical protein